MTNKHQSAIALLQQEIQRLESLVRDYDRAISTYKEPVPITDNVVRGRKSALDKIEELKVTLETLQTLDQPSMAAQIEEQIREGYQYEGRYYPPKADDIISHLESNNIDHDDPALFKHQGFDKADGGCQATFYYKDGSTLICSSSGVHAHG